MIGTVVNVLEFLFIFMASFQALVSFAKPTVRNIFCDMLYILPISIILPYFVAKVEAKETDNN
uniref:Serpentine receptor class gamma n=1 Tax=Strongyloides venezuelensis TaxID=75913 RepID=A0A0K0FLX1_STRVS